MHQNYLPDEGDYFDEDIIDDERLDEEIDNHENNSNNKDKNDITNLFNY